MAATAKAARKSTTRRKPASARSKVRSAPNRKVAAKVVPAGRTVSFAKVVQEANRLQRVVSLAAILRYDCPYNTGGNEAMKRSAINSSLHSPTSNSQWP